MIKKTILSLILLQSCLSPKSHAQAETRDDSVINNVLEQMWINTFQLMGSRGIIDYPYNNVKFKTADVLKTLRSNWDSSRHKVGMLIYLFDRGDQLTMSYLNNAGKTDTLRTTVTKNRLAELERLLKLSIRAVFNKSSAETRGVNIRNTSATLNRDSLVTIISDILLPRRFLISTLDHLIILPTSNISAFPFAMLRVNDQPLIDKMSYSFIPSVGEFIIRSEIVNKEYYTAPKSDGVRNIYSGRENINYRDSIRYNPEQTVFIGNPSFTKFGNWDFKSLPGTEVEVNEISKGLREKIVLKGKDAAKAKVLTYLSQTEIIYFATHAVADSTDPLNKSFLLLAGANAKDAFLTTKEIQDLAKDNPVKALLVILSACETGLGKSHAGGMIGMSRAFLIAGAQNVLMSLWEISDAKTPVLMKYFFEYLDNDGKPQMFFPYGALRNAIIKYKKENKNPLHWAAFSVIGIPL